MPSGVSFLDIVEVQQRSALELLKADQSLKEQEALAERRENDRFNLDKQLQHLVERIAIDKEFYKRMQIDNEKLAESITKKKREAIRLSSVMKTVDEGCSATIERQNARLHLLEEARQNLLHEIQIRSDEVLASASLAKDGAAINTTVNGITLLAINLDRSPGEAESTHQRVTQECEELDEKLTELDVTIHKLEAEWPPSKRQRVSEADGTLEDVHRKIADAKAELAALETAYPQHLAELDKLGKSSTASAFVEAQRETEPNADSEAIQQ